MKKGVLIGVLLSLLISCRAAPEVSEAYTYNCGFMLDNTLEVEKKVFVFIGKENGGMVKPISTFDLPRNSTVVINLDEGILQNGEYFCIGYDE